jgi:hypothetical protein
MQTIRTEYQSKVVLRIGPKEGPKQGTQKIRRGAEKGFTAGLCRGQEHSRNYEHSNA